MERHGHIALFGEARCGCGQTQPAMVIGIHPQQGPVFAIPPGWTVTQPSLLTPGQPSPNTVRCPRCSQRAARNADAGLPRELVPNTDAGVKR